MFLKWDQSDDKHKYQADNDVDQLSDEIIIKIHLGIFIIYNVTGTVKHHNPNDHNQGKKIDNPFIINLL